MKCRFVILFQITIQAVVLLVIATPVLASVIAGPIINPANNHSYYLLDFSSWTDAEAEAISLKGHLVTINDQDENVWVTETFGNFGGVTYTLLWIGINDAAVEGTFVWSSGEPVTYTNWHAGEPNAAFSGEDYGHITITFGNGEWVDRRDSDGNRLYGVVEVSSTNSQTTFTVNSTADSGDSIPGDGLCDDGTGNCTLRAAILETNAIAGIDTIKFNIPDSGPHTIQPSSVLPSITDTVVIDGTTQPGFAGTPIIEVDGSNVDSGNGLEIISGNSTVRGLVINRFGRVGIVLAGMGGNVIENNFIGTDITGTIALGNGVLGVDIVDTPGNKIGGATPGTGNLISGNGSFEIEIIGNGATENLVQGNFIGTDVSATNALAKAFFGVMIQGGASINTIGGTIPGMRNVISGIDGAGVRIQSPGTTNNLVQGNFIGTDVTGTVALGNTFGVSVGLKASDNSIGGIELGAGNLISGNTLDGIGIINNGTNNRVQGNLIGTDVTGQVDLGNGRDGVCIQGSSSGNTIGGMTPEAANTIAFNMRNGIGSFFFPGIGNSILYNSIFENGGLGIDLGTDGVTLNDAGDSDTGANSLQNFPLLISATVTDSSISIAGTLNSTAATQFGVQFFSSVSVDPSGFGEGEVFIGETTVLTDSTGNLSFSVTFPVSIPSGEYVTCTATAPDGSTSEFSEALENVITTVERKTEETLPEAYALYQNYPNPFNPETEIRFSLPGSNHVLIKIYNILGEEIQTLVNKQYVQGNHRIRWNGKDKSGNPVSSGVYLYKLRAGSFVQIRKMTLIR